MFLTQGKERASGRNQRTRNPNDQINGLMDRNAKNQAIVRQLLRLFESEPENYRQTIRSAQGQVGSFSREEGKFSRG